MKLPGFRRQPRQVVNVDPVQLVVVHYLLRFGTGALDPLFTEAAAASAFPLPRAMFDAAMATLVADGLAEYRFDPERGLTQLVFTPLGERLRGKLPRESRSALAVYL